MPEFIIKFRTDPSSDIVLKQEKFYFGQKALVSTVGVSKVGGSGLYSATGFQQAIDATTDDNGIQWCKGCYYYYTLYSQQVYTYAPSLGMAAGVSSTTYVEGEIEIRIAWDSYTEPPDPPVVSEPPETINLNPDPTPPTPVDPADPSPVPEEQQPLTQTEWLEWQTIIRDGFNIKCINVYDKETLKHGEIRAAENIINDMIPDKAHAYRIGKKAIYDSEKNLDISVSYVPNFSIYPGVFVNMFITPLYFEEILPIKAVEFKSSGSRQEYILHMIGKKVV